MVMMIVIVVIVDLVRTYCLSAGSVCVKFV